MKVFAYILQTGIILIQQFTWTLTAFGPAVSSSVNSELILLFFQTEVVQRHSYTVAVPGAEAENKQVRLSAMVVSPCYELLTSCQCTQLQSLFHLE